MQIQRARDPEVSVTSTGGRIRRSLIKKHPLVKLIADVACGRDNVDGCLLSLLCCSKLVCSRFHSGGSANTVVTDTAWLVESLGCVNTDSSGCTCSMLE